MGIFWTVVTIGLVAVIVGVTLWAFVVAPFRVPRHAGR